MWEPDLITRAACFAAVEHRTQKRKYTAEPYVVHCIEVAAIVATVTDDREMIAAAYLHDTMEDCGVKSGQLFEMFGPRVADLVCWLTDVSTPEDGNRAARKALDRMNLSRAPAAAKTIKLADLISNSRTIAEHDKGFARVYMREKQLLLEVLRDGSAELYRQADAILLQYFMDEPLEEI